MRDADPIWTPDAASVAAANVTRFIRELGVPEVHDSPSLYRWSIEKPEAFWPAVWRFTGVIAQERQSAEPWDDVLVGRDRMAPPELHGPRWFPGARLNFAENLLRYRDDRDALVGWNERGATRRLTYAQLADAVARFAQFLRDSGVGVGDRVAGFVPNVPEAVVAMLATSSLGAIWSSCSPDFGRLGVLDRFGQIAPRVLVIANEYRYGGATFDSVSRVREFLPELPSVERVVVIANGAAETATDALDGLDNAVWWHDALPSVGTTPALSFLRLPFDHPLYIMYSSGTTGLPKCMVHGAGGTLVQHLKELVLHTDLSRADRILYFTTCGWMMWNWLVSSLAVGSTVVLYDGAPILKGRSVMWDIVAREGVTVFGTSAKWLALTEKNGVQPMETHDLSTLRAILSTGSPLAEPSYDYVYRSVKKDVRLSSISGGTDIISCFALGDPTLPVYRGELQTRGFGMRVEIWNDAGQAVANEAGELVCTAPFPSMPVAFWNDPDGARYHAAYFEKWPGVWSHGDFAALTEHGGLVIYGRSDATLNPGGVRIGTAEIYRQVEHMPEVLESVVIGQTVVTKRGTDDRIVLFVRLQSGLTLDDALRDRIRRQIRQNVTPHHVPKKILQVADIPRTISGKITELAVRDTVHGRAVKNIEALSNPESLALYRDRPELRD
ncbi:acetoacetate--CoA ligase [soil metagenome]